MELTAEALLERCQAWDERVEGISDFDDRWVHYLAGLGLLEQAQRLERNVGCAAALLHGLAILREGLNGQPQLAPLAAQEVEQLSAALDEVIADTGASPATQVGRLAGLQGRLRELELVTDGHDPTRHLDAELDGLGRVVDRVVADDPDSAEALEGVEAELRRSVLRRRADLELEPPTESDAPGRLWTRLGRINRFGDQCVEVGGADDVRARIDALREALFERLRARLAELSEDERRSWVDETAPVERELCDEVLTSVEEVPLDQGLARLHRARLKVEFLLAQRPAGGDATASRALGRYRAKLFNEWVEKTVSHRLERRFGYPFVRTLENTVLLLILLVCGFLVFELTAPHPPGPWLAWVDGAVCAVFLFEFFLKIGHAPARLNYLRRHWLVDLLPSIPFGLIFLGLGISGATGASSAAAARAVRLARLSRLTRYVRVARPLIRVFRILIFALRGMDRVVRRYGALINRNIVFFDPPACATQDVADRLEALRLRARHATRQALGDATSTERQGYVERRARVIHGRLANLGRRQPVGEETALSEAPSREIRVERLIENLMRLDAEVLQERFGADFSKRVARITQIASLPLLRRLPLFREIAAARREAVDDSERVTRCARALGRTLERLLARFMWFADLYGVVSAPLMIDRLGAAMAKATARPAKRLLMFGVLFLIVSGAAELLSFGALGNLVATLRKFLGLPIIILGAVCLLLMLIGRWFQKVAGQASEFYERAAEAQFLGLVKDVKRGGMETHRRTLERRILKPEARVTGRKHPGTATAMSRHSDLAHRLSTVLDDNDELEPGGPGERVYLLYRHYLDGAPLHRSGSTTVNQLLGNLVLENIQRERLKLTKKQRLAIERLDLERSKAALTGPYMWFNFITLAVAQRTARLIVEYNIHCVPLDERGLYSEEELTSLAAWLAARASQQADDERVELLAVEARYRTTAFTALDFLTSDPERDAAIGHKFGEDVAAAVAIDRRRVVREVFSTFPFRTWAKAERSINVADLYWRYFGGGRALLLPLTLGWILVRIGWFLLIQLAVTIRDLLDPALGATSHDAGVSDYAVVMRKVNRMRKPIFIEAARLRARFDVEYMGLHLPGQSVSGLEGQDYEDDLEFIGALEEEQIEFDQMAEQHQHALRMLSRLMRHQGWEGGGFGEYLRDVNPGLAERPLECLRSVAIAFAIDYQEVCTQAELAFDIEDQLERAIAHEGRMPGETRGQRVRGALWRALCYWTPTAIRRRRRFDGYWQRHHAERPDAERVAARRVAVIDRGLARDLRRAAKLGQDPRALAVEQVRQICLHPHPWTEQLLTLRTVQTLAMLDVLSDRQIVRDLGEYHDAPEPVEPVVLARL